MMLASRLLILSVASGVVHLPNLLLKHSMTAPALGVRLVATLSERRFLVLS